MGIELWLLRLVSPGLLVWLPHLGKTRQKWWTLTRVCQSGYIMQHEFPSNTCCCISTVPIQRSSSPALANPKMSTRAGGVNGTGLMLNSTLVYWPFSHIKRACQEFLCASLLRLRYWAKGWQKGEVEEGWLGGTQCINPNITNGALREKWSATNSWMRFVHVNSQHAEQAFPVLAGMINRAGLDINLIQDPCVSIEQVSGFG